jgi:hypothetical protein
MMFYKHRFFFWKRYASIPVQLSLFVHHFLLALVSAFRPYRATRKEKEKVSIILLVLSFLFQPKILPASVYNIHISIRRYTNTRVPFFSFLLVLVLAKFGVDIILLFPCTRIECAYRHTKRNHQWYIYKSIVRFYSVVYISSSWIYIHVQTG